VVKFILEAIIIMKHENEGKCRVGEPLEERLHRLAREFSELERLRRDVRKAEQMLDRRGKLSGKGQNDRTFGQDRAFRGFVP
jgi:hypothetical protein